MRSTFFFAALLVVVALGARLVVRTHDEPATTASIGTVTLVGDSLNVGVEPSLAGPNRRVIWVTIWRGGAPKEALR